MEQKTGNTHAKRALFELRQRILDGTLQGGTRLYEVALAEKLKISRTPVRDAISRLVEEGLLERQGGGVVVRSFTYLDVIDAIEFRGVLEGAAARLAAERGADAESLTQIKHTLDKLDACFGTSATEVDFDAYAELNAMFHDEMALLCPSAVLRRELERAKSLPFASPSACLPDKLDVDAFSRSLFIAQEQHRAIVNAIENREGGRAEAIAREHARIALKNLEFVIHERSDLASQLPSLAIVVR